MASVMKFDQVGLVPAGVDDQSRLDGLDTGATVTVTNVSPGGANSLQFLWVPLEETTVPTLTPAGNTWTFNPTAGVYGPYVLRLTVDSVVSERAFWIPSPVLGLILPALNEEADRTANLLNNGPSQISASLNNAPITGTRLSGGNYTGWWYAMDRSLRAMETMASDLAAKAGVFHQSFTNGDLSSGLLTVTHSLGNRYADLAVYNNNNKKIWPGDVEDLDANSLRIDLSDYQSVNGGALPGTWNVVVVT